MPPTDLTGIAWETFHTSGSIPVYCDDTRVFNHGSSTVPTDQAEGKACCVPKTTASEEACGEPKVLGEPYCAA